MAFDPHMDASDEPSKFRARLRKLVTLTAFVVGGASLLAVGVVPSQQSRASMNETRETVQKKSGLKLGLIGECGVDEPEPVADAAAGAGGSCGRPIAASTKSTEVADADELDRVDLNAVGECRVAISALDNEHVPAELLLTSRW